MTQPAKQLEKYQRVLGFYGQNLNVLQAQLQTQNRIVDQQRGKLNRLHGQLEATEQSFAHSQPSPGDLQMVSHLMTNLELSIAQATRELNEAERELESRRAEVRDQMSKTEALQKIVAQTSDAIEYSRRRLEQIQSDERYLNKYFTG